MSIEAKGEEGCGRPASTTGEAAGSAITTSARAGTPFIANGTTCASVRPDEPPPIKHRQAGPRCMAHSRVAPWLPEQQACSRAPRVDEHRAATGTTADAHESASQPTASRARYLRTVFTWCLERVCLYVFRNRPTVRERRQPLRTPKTRIRAETRSAPARAVQQPDRGRLLDLPSRHAGAFVRSGWNLPPTSANKNGPAAATGAMITAGSESPKSQVPGRD